eukprot:g4172.t1
MTISFGDRTPTLDVFESPDDALFFPARVLTKRSNCFDEAVWSKLLRPESGDPRPDAFRYQIKESAKLVCVTHADDDPTSFPLELRETFQIVRIVDRIEEGDEGNAIGNGEDVDGGFDPLASLFGVAREKIRNSVDMAESAFDGDVDEVKRLLEVEGYHVDSVEENDHTALSEASAQNHVELVKYLLECGADPNHCAGKGDGRTALYRAAFNGHVKTVNLLLRAGADPDHVCETTNECAMDAATEKDVQDVLLLWDREETAKLKAAREEKIREEREKRIRSAAERELLLKRDFSKRLINASAAGDVETLEKLLVSEAEAANDEDRRPRGLLGTTRDDRGNTLLAIAAWKGQERVVRWILRTKLPAISAPKENAEEDKKNEDEDENAYEDDDTKRRREAVRRGLSPPAINARDQKGWTACQIACFHKHKRIIQMLLDAGADPLLRNAYGKNAFDLAKLARPPEANVGLMRWYDKEKFEKDMARVAAHKNEIEGTLEAWRAEKAAFAKTLGAETAAAEAAKEKVKTEGTQKKKKKKKTPTAIKKKKNPGGVAKKTKMRTKKKKTTPGRKATG